MSSQIQDRSSHAPASDPAQEALAAEFAEYLHLLAAEFSSPLKHHMEAHEEAMRVRFRETSDAFMATSREAEQLATVASRTLVSSVGQMTALLDRHEEMIVTLRNEVKRSNFRVLVVVGVGCLLTMATILVTK